MLDEMGRHLVDIHTGIVSPSNINYRNHDPPSYGKTSFALQVHQINIWSQAKCLAQWQCY